MSRVHRALRAYRKQEDGTATVEAVLWIPLFVGIFVLIADASLLFNSQAQMLRLVQDANRAYSTGQLETTDDVETYLLGHALPISAESTVTAEVDTTVVPAGVITTTMTIPASALAAIGILPAFIDFNLTVGAQHYVEF